MTESCTFGSQLIQVRCLHMGMSFGAKGVATPFICTNEDHIGLGHVLLSLGRHVADFI